MQLPLFAPESDWRPPSVSSLPSWAGAKRIAIDTETRDPSLRELGPGVRRGGYMVGASVAIEDGPSFYIPLRHQGGDNVPLDEGLRYLRDNAAAFTGDVVGARLDYDLDYLLEDGVEFGNARFFRDIQIAAPLIYELHDSFSLDNIAKRLGLPGKNEEKLREAARAYGVDPKGGLWRLPARFVGLYAEVDVEQPLAASRRQERQIDEDDLWDVYDLESRVLPVLVRMRRRGIRIDLKRLEEIETWTLMEEEKECDFISRESGVRVARDDLTKAVALAPALEAATGVKLNSTAKGLPNIDVKVLSDLDHPVAASMLRARKINKLRTTFCASIRRHMTNGRIHCTFNQIAREDDSGDQKGARYGRLSSVNPNLQQQPARDEELKVFREIYVPEEGAILGAPDYSQQEPRWTTHFAAVMRLEGAEEAARAYRENPLIDNHQFMADLTGLPRKFAKNVYLGLCYGEGGATLCKRDLGLPTRWACAVGGRGSDRPRQVHYAETREEALTIKMDLGEGFVWEAAGEEGQQVLDTFDARAPFIRKLARKASKVAGRRGYVTTICGRRLHFPQRQDGSFDWTHKALNRVIQGSSADQMKTAMVLIDREMSGTFIQLQVHDELVGSFGDVAELKKVAGMMRDAIPDTLVPFRVDAEFGPNWGNLEIAA